MHWLKVVCVVIALSATPLRGASPDQRYIELYNLIQEGDQLRQNGQGDAARLRYSEAQTGLKELQKSSPNWNRSIIEFRLNYLQERIGAAPAPTPTTPVSRPAIQPVTQPSKTLYSPTPEPKMDERDAKVSELSATVAQLQGQITVLNEKLKEALALQPAAVDPRELAKAEERIRTLQKEKDLLQVALKQEQGKKPADPAQLEPALKTVDQLRAELAKVSDARDALKKENDRLVASAGQQSSNRKAPEAANSELAQLRATLQERETALKGATDRLKKAEADLAARLKDDGNEKRAAKLEKELAETREDLSKAEASLKVASSDLKAARSELAAKAKDDSAKKIARLEKDRAELEEKIEELRADLKKKGKSPDGSSTQLAALRARIEVLEASKTPFTAEELALMREPAASAPKVETASAVVPPRSRALPAGGGPMAREAQAAFAAGKFKEAEEKYQQVLKLDEKNVQTLANLGSIQMEMERYEEARKHLERAIELDPEDAFSQLKLGVLHLRQDRFDEAFERLSRAAQLDPTDPETQIYLGVTLSEKGQRGPAEAALRKALQLSPNNPAAHHNLAIIYLSQKPAFTQLARYHYQKALSAGHAKNPDLEKMIEEAEKK